MWPTEKTTVCYLLKTFFRISALAVPELEQLLAYELRFTWIIQIIQSIVLMVDVARTTV